MTGTSVQAQCRAYRRACLEEILPLEKGKGWDGVDTVKANLRGWRTAAFDDLQFLHHRPIGARERSRIAAWRQEGRAAHYMGYRPSYLLARALFRCPRDPAALLMIAGFASASLARNPRCDDASVHAFLRRQQAPWRLPLRAAEAVGLRARRQADCLDVLLVADPGGHLVELLALQEVWSRFKRAWVTVEGADISLLRGEEVFLASGPTQRSVRKLVRNALIATSLSAGCVRR